MENEVKKPISHKQLAIREVLKEAWQLTYGLKWPVAWLGFVLMLIFIIIVSLVFLSVLPLIYYFMAKHLATAVATGVSQGLNNVPVTTTVPSIMPSIIITIPLVLLLFIFYFISWFVSAMLLMLGVRQSINLQPQVKVVFRECKNVWKSLFKIFLIVIGISIVLFICEFLFKNLGIAGTILNIILKIAAYYISWSISIFAVPLIVTRHFPALHAFKVGLNAMNLNWKVIVPTYIIMFFILVLSMIPLGIGLIWTMPMLLVINGIFFRDIFGLQKAPAQISSG